MASLLNKIRYGNHLQTAGATRSIMLMLVAFFLFSIQDVIIKILSDDYALMQIVLIRTLFTLPIVFTILHFDGGLATLRTSALKLQLARGLAMFLAYIFFYMALATLPFSLHIALFFSSPLFITILSAPLLGEQVGWRCWLAVLVGFGGVLVIVDPRGVSFEPATLFTLASALMYALSIIATRKLDDRASSITVYTALVYLAGASLLSPIFANIDMSSAHPTIAFLTMAWPTPLLKDILLILLISIFWGTGMVMLSSAYSKTAVATLAPFEYFTIFYGILFGYMIWGEIPSLIMIIGVALIVSSGLFIIYRENRAQ